MAKRLLGINHKQTAFHGAGSWVGAVGVLIVKGLRFKVRAVADQCRSIQDIFFVDSLPSTWNRKM